MPGPLPRLLLLLVLLPAAGCGAEPPAAANTAPPAAIATAFDPGKCGRLAGRVTWNGPLPEAPTFIFGMPKKDGSFDVRLMPNPNRPQIDPNSRAVANAVVYLRKIDTAAAKPWTHGDVRVELTDRQIVVRQGDDPPRRVGFVRRGKPVDLVATDPFFHALRGRGAAFFTFPFPDSVKERTRAFDTVGRVELSSAAGFYWASADLFVDDHPYYTLTNREGRFVLDDVPAGSPELVVWLPGWGVTKQERDPESGLVTRQLYDPPTEVRTRVAVAPGQTEHVAVTLP